MPQRRAQVAIEFLMTYGWALIAVLVALGALAYFGVLNPSRGLPERCTFPQELPCLEWQQQADSVKFKLKNGAAPVINITRLEYREASEGAWKSCNALSYDPGNRIPIEGSTTITCDLQETYEQGRRLKLKFRILYNYGNANFNHTGLGEIYANVQ